MVVLAAVSHTLNYGIVSTRCYSLLPHPIEGFTIFHSDQLLHMQLFVHLVLYPWHHVIILEHMVQLILKLTQVTDS